MTAARRDSAVSIALLYPELLGTYGDGGNATVLARRLAWRGIPVEIVRIALGTPVPEQCEVYVLGGGEDAPQALAARALADPPALRRAVDGGAAVLAVCAGLQVVGTRFRAGGDIHTGVGLVDVESGEALEWRAVGELVVDPRPGLPLGVLSGYENHASATVLGAGVPPLGRVVSGVGNGEASVDGFVAGRIVGTYLHGPVLARNADLADLILSWVVGDLPASSAVDDADRDADELRRHRLAAARHEASRPPAGTLGRLREQATSIVGRVAARARPAQPDTPWRRVN